MATKILVLEDDESIRSMLVINIKKHGFIVYECATGEEALLVAQTYSDIDIAILDIMLPGIDGIEVCKALRDMHPFIGIIMLTAKTQEKDKVYALESGADDYVTKPFGISELMARVNSLLRRVKIHTEVDISNTENNIESNSNNAKNSRESNAERSTEVDISNTENNIEVNSNDAKNNIRINTESNTRKITLGKFEIDDFSKKFYKEAKKIDLTPTEFSIIKLFMENPNKAIDRDEILTKIWGEYYFGELKIVDVNIRRIRKKIEEDPSNPKYIETVWGVGYRWKEEETS